MSDAPSIFGTPNISDVPIVAESKPVAAVAPFVSDVVNVAQPKVAQPELADLLHAGN